MAEMHYTDDRDKAPYAAMGADLGKLTEEKNASYGDSFARSGEIMAILYPNGITPDQYRDALGVVRVIDKLFRIATRKDAFGESPWRDVGGYGIVAAVADERRIPPPPRVPVFTDPLDSPIPYTVTTDQDAEANSVTEGPPPNDTRIDGLGPKYRVRCVWANGSKSATHGFSDLLSAFDSLDDFAALSAPGDEAQILRGNDLLFAYTGGK